MATLAASVNLINTTTGNKTTAGMSCSVNDFIVVAAATSGATATSQISDSNADGGGPSGGAGYLAVQNAGRGGTDAYEMWIRTTPIRVAASTTFTRVPGASDTGGGLWVGRITGMEKFGLSGVRQSGKQVDGAAASTPTVTPNLGAILTTNLVVGSVWNATNPATMTPPTSASYTEDL